MSIRKIFLIFTIVFSTCLFYVGINVLSYNGRTATNHEDINNNEKVQFGELIVNPLDSLNSLNFFNQTPLEPVNILILGGDKVNNNTDSILVANINAKDGKIHILSIPRDTKVTIYHATQKINAAYPIGGAKLAMETVGKLLGLKIEYYAFVDTTAFKKIINLVDGVAIDVPCKLDYDDPLQKLHIHLDAGMQLLDGDKAEQFMRFRHYNTSKVNKFYDGSDLKRINAQQNFIKELINQKANIFYISKLKEMLDIIYKNVETNFSLEDVLKLTSDFSTFDSQNMKMLVLPGEDSYNILWYFIYDKAKTRELVNQYFRNGSNSGENYVEELEVEPEKPLIRLNKKQKSKSFSKGNPSNSETEMKSTGIEVP